MLKNCDGTPYKLSGTLSKFDPEGVDVNLFNLVDQEITEIGGTPIFYYEVFIQLNNTFDPLYLEDRGKLFSPTPIQLFGYYNPIPSQNYMNAFGMDSPNDEIQIEFNYRDVLQRIGHPPKIGSRLWTPHLREDWFIQQRNLGGFKLWSATKLMIIAERFQESTTTNEGDSTQPQPDYRLNEGQLFEGASKSW